MCDLKRQMAKQGISEPSSNSIFPEKAKRSLLCAIIRELKKYFGCSRKCFKVITLHLCKLNIVKIINVTGSIRIVR